MCQMVLHQARVTFMVSAMMFPILLTSQLSSWLVATVIGVIFVVNNVQKIIFCMISFNTVSVCMKFFMYKYLATCMCVHVCVQV